MDARSPHGCSEGRSRLSPRVVAAPRPPELVGAGIPLGVRELPYAALQAPVLLEGRGGAARDLGGQPKALVLKAPYLRARLLGIHGSTQPLPRTSSRANFSDMP